MPWWDFKYFSSDIILLWIMLKIKFHFSDDHFYNSERKNGKKYKIIWELFTAARWKKKK